MDLLKQNGREKSSSLTAPGRLEKSFNQSLKNSPHTNLSSINVDKSDEINEEGDLLIKVIKFTRCWVFFALMVLLCICEIGEQFKF